jgi:hypothetical protein
MIYPIHFFPFPKAANQLFQVQLPHPTFRNFIFSKTGETERNQSRKWRKIHFASLLELKKNHTYFQLPHLLHGKKFSFKTCYL